MNKNEYKTIKKIMDNPELADEIGKVHSGIKDQMAGFLLHPWLPVGIGRKIIMLVIVLVSITAAEIYQNNFFYLLLLILPFFSPRISGETLMFIGKISKN
jgi:hypothetical protein